MPARPLVDVEGAVDIHIHAAPSYSHSRPYDDDVTARQGAEHGLAAVLLKDHTESTVTRTSCDQGGRRRHPRLGDRPQPSGRRRQPRGGGLRAHDGRQEGLDADGGRRSPRRGVWPGGYTLKTSGVGTAEPDKKSRHLLRKKPIRIVENGKLSDDAKDVVRSARSGMRCWGLASVQRGDRLPSPLREEEKFAKVVIVVRTGRCCGTSTRALSRRWRKLGA